ncbi:hypothetical protein MHYP_G00163830 [Metynnis hypsauchen]
MQLTGPFNMAPDSEWDERKEHIITAARYQPTLPGLHVLLVMRKSGKKEWMWNGMKGKGDKKHLYIVDAFDLEMRQIEDTGMGDLQTVGLLLNVHSNHLPSAISVCEMSFERIAGCFKSPLSPAVPPFSTSQDVFSPLSAVAHSAAEAFLAPCQPSQMCLQRASTYIHTVIGALCLERCNVSQALSHVIGDIS